MKTIESLFDVKLISDREVGCRLDTSANSGASLGLYILDERGESVPESDTLKWGEWFEVNPRSLGDDSIGPYRVSTIFLGVDYSFGDGPPVLWETIIFGMPEEMEVIPKIRRRKRKSFRKTVEMMRYTSKAEALAGHASAIRLAESLPQAV